MLGGPHIRAGIGDVFGVDIDPNAQWDVQWLAAPPLWVTVLLLCVPLALFVYWLYRGSATPAGRGRRALLAATRFFAVLCVILMLFDPVLTVEKEITRRAYVAVLVDDSLSMAFVDRHADPEVQTALARAAGFIGAEEALTASAQVKLETTSRWDLLRAVWRAERPNFLGKLEQTHLVKLYGFSTRLRRNPKLADEAAPTGSHTKLGDAVRDVLDDLKGQAVAGIVVISDGRSNSGELAPIEAARLAATHGAAGVPIFPVAVGAVDVPKDLEMLQVRAPDVVLTGEQVQIDYVVRHTGFPGESVRVELHKDGADGEILEDTELVLRDGATGDRFTQRAQLRLPPFDEEGEYELVLLVPPDPEDVVPSNNIRRIRIRVVDGTLKVLYVDGRPRFEYRHLSMALIRDKRIAVNCLLADADVGVPQRRSNDPRVTPLMQFPSEGVGKDGQPGLFDYDCVIIGDVAFELKRGMTIFPEPDRHMALLERYVEEAGGGIIFLAGLDANPSRYRGTPLETLLPVELLSPERWASERGNAFSDEPIMPVVTEKGQGHSLLQLHPDPRRPELNTALWQGDRRLNGFYWVAPVRGPKLHAEVLLRHPGIDEATRPILATMWYGRGRTVYVGTDEIWRWRELQGDRYYYRFFSNLIRYVGHNRLLGDERRYELSLERSNYTLGERVTVRARRWDDNFQKLAGVEDVTIKHETEDGTIAEVKLGAVPNAPGEFEASIVAQQLGAHRVWFETTKASGTTGKAALVSFDVTVPQRELENPAMDITALQALWDESGAAAAALRGPERVARTEFFQLWELGQVAGAIPERTRILSGVDAVYRLWDTWLVFFLLLGLLCLEWIVRKLTRLP